MPMSALAAPDTCVSDCPTPASALKADRVSGKGIFHKLGGDDLVAYFGFEPKIEVVSQHTPNAYAIGPSTIVISTALLDFLEGESELAFVLAHELAHLILGHTHKNLAGNRELRSSPWVRYLKAELAADNLALQLLKKGHYSGAPGLAVLKRLANFGAESGTSLGDIFPSLAIREGQLALALERTAP